MPRFRGLWNALTFLPREAHRSRDCVVEALCYNERGKERNMTYLGHVSNGVIVLDGR